MQEEVRGNIAEANNVGKQRRGFIQHRVKISEFFHKHGNIFRSVSLKQIL